MNTEYIFKNDKKAADRLKVQHQLYKHSSESLLLEAGLKPDMKVLEVGCGMGAMTEWLADQVGKTGHLTAIDINQNYVDLVKNKYLGRDNILITQADIYNLEALAGTFDLIYIRMVLHHLKEPLAAIRQLKNKLNKNGVIVFEEPPAMEGAYTFPYSETFQKLKQKVVSSFINNQVKYDVAFSLPYLLEKENLKVTKNSIFHPLCATVEERLLYLQAFEEILPVLLKFELINENEVDQFAANLKHDLLNAEVVSYICMHQVVAGKM